LGCYSVIFKLELIAVIKILDDLQAHRCNLSYLGV
jgi:hypothetical protein